MHEESIDTLPIRNSAHDSLGRGSSLYASSTCILCLLTIWPINMFIHQQVACEHVRNIGSWTWYNKLYTKSMIACNRHPSNSSPLHWKELHWNNAEILEALKHWNTPSQLPVNRIVHIWILRYVQIWGVVWTGGQGKRGLMLPFSSAGKSELLVMRGPGGRGALDVAVSAVSGMSTVSLYSMPD
jgi:hypothetical protein